MSFFDDLVDYITGNDDEDARPVAATSSTSVNVSPPITVNTQIDLEPIRELAAAVLVQGAVDAEMRNQERVEAAALENQRQKDAESLRLMIAGAGLVLALARN